MNADDCVCFCSLSVLRPRCQVYLGAPWNWCNKGIGDWCFMGGNGGTSYRRRSVMLDLTREIGCTDWRCDWVDLYPQAQHGNDNWKHVRTKNDAHCACAAMHARSMARCFPCERLIRCSSALVLLVSAPLAQVEDTYFARMLYERRHKYQGLIATPEQSSEFCMESIPGPDEVEVNPWFVHKIWSYIKHQRYTPIMSHTMQYYPEASATHAQEMRRSDWIVPTNDCSLVFSIAVCLFAQLWKK